MIAKLTPAHRFIEGLLLEGDLTFLLEVLGANLMIKCSSLGPTLSSGVSPLLLLLLPLLLLPPLHLLLCWLELGDVGVVALLHRPESRKSQQFNGQRFQIPNNCKIAIQSSVAKASSPGCLRFPCHRARSLSEAGSRGPGTWRHQATTFCQTAGRRSGDWSSNRRSSKFMKGSLSSSSPE